MTLHLSSEAFASTGSPEPSPRSPKTFLARAAGAAAIGASALAFALAGAAPAAKIAAPAASAATTGGTPAATAATVSLDEGFVAPPEDIRVGCYWYWTRDGIRKDGIVADIRAMKKAGVTRAYIGLVGGGNDPVIFTQEWWDLVHTALKTATEEGVEMGVFNCPGWSQSGGPWIKTSESMRYLTAITAHARGPSRFSKKLTVTKNDLLNADGLQWSHEVYRVSPKDFQDFKVLAFPVNDAYKNLLALPGTEVTVFPPQARVDIASKKNAKGARDKNAAAGSAKKNVPRIEILSATYGANGRYAAPEKVLAAVKKLIAFSPEIGVNGVTDAVGDPAFGVRKTLSVTYLLDGKKVTAAAFDGDTLFLTKAEFYADPSPVRFPWNLVGGKNNTATIKFAEPKTVQGLVLYLRRGFRSKAELHVRDGGTDAKPKYRPIKAFTIDRSDSGLSRGFNPDAPVAIAFPETTSNEFRLVFHDPRGALTDIRLQQAPVVERFSEKTYAKMFNSFAPPWNAFQWQQQTTDASLSIPQNKVLDISDKLAPDGTLTWDVPAGEWVILRTGMVPTGLTNSPSPKGGDGPEVDKMNYEYVARHFDKFVGEIIRRVPAADRKSLKISVLDSYEKGGQNITDGFVEIFKDRYKYDPTPFFPSYYGYTVGSPDLTDRFLWDMRRLVADKISHNYVRALSDKSHANGMTTWLENYGTWGFPGDFLQYGGQADEVGGEFWMGGLSSIGIPENRCATSCAHTYGKNKVWAEAFTAGGDHFRKFPTMLKVRGDQAFGEGINSWILHVNIQQDADEIYPGFTAWYNTEFNRKNTWYSQLDLFTTYARRCGFLLSRGVDVADVAYYVGDDAPKMQGREEPRCPKGRHHDFIGSEVLLRDAVVKDGNITLPHGTTYSVLVLPPQAEIRPEVLRKIEQLVKDGATILGYPFDHSPSLENYPAADAEVRAISQRLWGENAGAVVKTKGILESLPRNPDGSEPKQYPDVAPAVRDYGKGKVYINTKLEDIFAAKEIGPDVWWNDKDPLTYNHRRTADGVEIYFLANSSQKTVTISPEFRVTGLVPELWEPVTGAKRELPTFMPCKKTTVVPLRLAPQESVFVIFRKNGKKPRSHDLAANYNEPTQIAEITTPWTVTFQSDPVRRGPATPVVFKELVPWRDRPEANIKYYSGAAVYKNTFAFDAETVAAAKKTKIYLDLGKASVSAKVKINGHYAGGAWTPPYRVEIGKHLRPGTNTIEIEVVGTWINRMVGDARLPAPERKVNIVGLNEKSPLDESGLLGPVKLLRE